MTLEQSFPVALGALATCGSSGGQTAVHVGLFPGDDEVER